MHPIHTTIQGTLARIRESYAEVRAARTPLSIASLLNTHDCRIQDYCSTYHPHPEGDHIVRMVQVFGQQHGIWLDHAKHYVTCATFFFPTAIPERLVAITKALSIDYYLNDTMGRDIFTFLPPDQQQEAGRIIRRMGNMDERLLLSAEAYPVERANAAVLGYFRDTAPAGWFRQFVKTFSYHLAITYKDCNASTLGHIPGIREYMDIRRHYGGMPHMVLWAEYCNGNFLDWNWLKAVHLDKAVEQLTWDITAFGVLSNDFFSFETEVIDDGTDSNLLMIVALNKPAFSFLEVIDHAGKIVRDIFMDYLSLMEQISSKCRMLPGAASDNLLAYLDVLTLGMQSCWVWQGYTRRYKRPHSLWEETRLQRAVQTS